MSDYDEAMEDLAACCADAYIAAIKAFKAADNEDGAPAHHLREMKDKLLAISDDVNSLINYRATVAEARDMEALYKGAKLAGLTS